MRNRSKLFLATGALGGAAFLASRAARRKRLEQTRPFESAVALVTGGSRGLGFLIARELASEGARLVLCARDASELERARRALEAEGADVNVIECDVADREQVESLVREATKRYGPIDVLVNNAGIITVGPVETMTVADYEGALGVMFWGALYPTLAVLPSMIERQSGRIVNITSIGGKLSVPHMSPYAAAKFAAVGFSEGLRAELAEHGIQVTTVVPGLMRTGSHVNAEFKGVQEEEYRWFALGASLPLVSKDAEAAARAIVRAVKRGDAEYVVGWPARIASLVHGVFPGITAELASVANRFLPRQMPANRKVPGRELERRRRSWIWKAVTTLGRDSVGRFQEHRTEEPVARSLPVSYP